MEIFTEEKNSLYKKIKLTIYNTNFTLNQINNIIEIYKSLLKQIIKNEVYIKTEYNYNKNKLKYIPYIRKLNEIFEYEDINIYLKEDFIFDIDHFKNYKFISDNPLIWFIEDRNNLKFINYNNIALYDSSVNDIEITTLQEELNNLNDIYYIKKEDNKDIILKLIESYKITVYLETDDFYFVDEIWDLYNLKDCIYDKKRYLITIKYDHGIYPLNKSIEELKQLVSDIFEIMKLKNLIKYIKIFENKSLKLPLDNIDKILKFQSLFYNLI